MRCWHCIDRAEATAKRNRGLTVICKTILDAINDIEFIEFIDEINACCNLICSILTGCSPLSSARGGTLKRLSGLEP